MTAAAAAPRSKAVGFTPDRWMLLLLIFIPLAPIAEWLHWGPLLVFAFAGLAIVPLAGMMGEATEQLAHRLGAGIGGLLNATFGNAAELIIAVMALRRGLYDVVQASLTGSIIGNSLLVLGLAVLAGGIRREKQTFDRAAAGVGSTMLSLAAIGLVIPALYHWTAEGAVARHALRRPYSQTSIDVCTLGADAVAMGAATLPIAQLLSDGGLPEAEEPMIAIPPRSRRPQGSRR